MGIRMKVECKYSHEVCNFALLKTSEFQKDDSISFFLVRKGHRGDAKQLDLPAAKRLSLDAELRSFLPTKVNSFSKIHHHEKWTA